MDACPPPHPAHKGGRHRSVRRETGAIGPNCGATVLGRWSKDAQRLSLFECLGFAFFCAGALGFCKRRLAAPDAGAQRKRHSLNWLCCGSREGTVLVRPLGGHEHETTSLEETGDHRQYPSGRGIGCTSTRRKESNRESTLSPSEPNGGLTPWAHRDAAAASVTSAAGPDSAASGVT
jgi:hypothetical protein